MYSDGMGLINKVVIPAAGWGTRFLPTTKAVPKELIPLIGKPVIHYGVEEAANSGITQAIVVTSTGKGAIKEYFRPNQELEELLRDKGRIELLQEVQEASRLAEMQYVIQEEQLGLGHAILVAADAVGKEPFAVLLPDDVIPGEVPVLKQMLDLYRRYEASIVAVEKVTPEQVSGYGIVSPEEEVAPGFYKLNGLVEKPSPQDAPSDLGIVGRYVFTPAIFDALRETRPGALDELQLTDGMANLLKSEPLYAYQLQSVRHDAGTPLGLIKASIQMGLRDDAIGGGLREFLDRMH